MKVEQKGNTIIIRDTQGDVEAFLMKVTHEHKSFENHNLILEISSDENVGLKNIVAFAPLSKLHRKAKKSLVLVVPNIDFNALPASVMVVPSLLEAHDIIEMEEMERDMGF